MSKTSCVEKQGDFSDCVLTIQQERRYAEAEKYTCSELQAVVRKRRRMWGLQTVFTRVSSAGPDKMKTVGVILTALFL